MSDNDFTYDEAKLLAELRAENLSRENGARRALAQVCEALQALGVQSVRVEYDGYGDSGSIEALSLEPLTDVAEAHSNAIEECGYTLLPGGWELADGPCGEVAIDINERKVSWRQQMRYTN
jgi:hypothetical protein